MAEVKTAQQRQVEVASMLKSIDSAVSAEMPKDIAEIVSKFDGVNAVDLLKVASDMVLNKSAVREITTKKGATLYEIFTTGGFGLKKLGKVNNRTLEVKVSMFLR